MSEGDRLFAVAPLGGARLLIAAARIEEIAPDAVAQASEWSCIDLACTLGLEAVDAQHGVLVSGGGRAAWLLVDRGTRFTRLSADALQALPAWLHDASSPLCGLALLSDEGFAFELNVDQLLETGPT